MASRKVICLAYIALVSSFLAAGPAGAGGGAPDNPRTFITGQAGTLPSDPRFLAGTYFREASVKGLIEALEAGPAGIATVREALNDSPVTVEDLLRVGLLRQDGEKFWIGFNYFTAEDMRKIHEQAEKRVPDLLERFSAADAQLKRILALYPVQTVDRKKLAFVLLAGFSLNWDGLKTSLDQGYRKPVLIQGDRWRYSFFAAENDPDYSIREFYWGSSSFPLGEFNFADNPVDFAFSSFGDPYSDPRMNFPDLFYISGENMLPEVREKAAEIGLIRDSSFGLDLENVLGLEFVRPVGEILFALRRQPQTLEDLREAVSAPAKLRQMMALLAEIQYVEQDEEGRYHLTVPVLDYDDQEMVDGVLRLSRGLINGWLGRHYEAMREELGSLTAMEHGVPFESLFTQIWHELFGLATRDMARSGLIANPSAGRTLSIGSVPVLWRHSLYDFEPQ